MVEPSSNVEVQKTEVSGGGVQDCYRVLVSLISWPGQLLSLFPCQRIKFLARMLFLGILSLTVVKCRKEEGKDKDEIVLLKQNEI